MRSALAWLLTAPLALVGSQIAHDAAYLGAEPDDDRRSHLLESTGHGYLAEVAKPTALIAVALCLAALALYYVLRAARRPARAARGGAVRRSCPWLRSCSRSTSSASSTHGQLPLRALLEPPILLGLVLQLPFALLAYGVAWLLLRATEALVRALGGEWRDVSSARRRSPRAPLAVLLPRTRVRARGYTGRGPPLAA